MWSRNLATGDGAEKTTPPELKEVVAVSPEHLSLVSIAAKADASPPRSGLADSRQFSGFGSASDLKALYHPAVAASAAPRDNFKGNSLDMLAGSIEARQRDYIVKAGETPESIASRELGRGASAEVLKYYCEVVRAVNSLEDGQNPKTGAKLLLPALHKDGSFSFVNPDDTNQSYRCSKDGIVHAEDKQTKEGFEQKTNADGSHTRISWGPKPDDNATVTTYVGGSERTEYKDGRGFTHNSDGSEKHWGPRAEDNWTRDIGGARIENKLDGSTVTSWADGSELHKFKDGRGFSKSRDGNLHAWGPKSEDNYDVSKDGTKSWKDHWGVEHSTSPDGTFTLGTKRFHLSGGPDNEFALKDDKGSSYELRRDCAITKTNPDGSVTRYESNFDQITTYSDGTEKQTNPVTGTGYLQKSDGKGGYDKHHWGKKPEDNYEEKYDAASGITTKVDSRGDKTTIWPNTGSKVERHDKTGHVRQPDGSEHHWGPTEKDNLDTKADQSKAVKARRDLEKIADSEIPKKDRALFSANLNKFEERAKRDHLPPEEVAQTYEQISRMLSASEAKVNKPNRVLLAENMAHHLNNDESVDQGHHNTCNVTTLAEKGFSRNPAKMAEMLATTSINGSWTAPDGKKIGLEPGSLIPREEESKNPPTDGERSYATQLLNLVMVNDATQRRLPPRYYRQGNPDPKIDGDTGERMVDGNGRIVTEKEKYVDFTDSPPHTKYRDVPVHAPTLRDSEIYSVGKRVFGASDFFLSPAHRASGDGVVKYDSQQQMQEKIMEMKNQNRLPAVLWVDGESKPFGTEDAGGGHGSHVVSLRDFDPASGRVRISNQWGSGSDQWVHISDLYKNTTS